jgi:CheY-like chemotaxis protein
MKKIERVTLIEDDPISAMIAKRLLSKFEEINSVQIYPNGKAAFDAFEDIQNLDITPTDLILLDIFMPIWDGWEFLEEFRKLHKFQSIPLYILTSSNSQEDNKRAKEFGLEKNYITKPLDLPKLEKILN